VEEGVKKLMGVRNWKRAAQDREEWRGLIREAEAKKKKKKKKEQIFSEHFKCNRNEMNSGALWFQIKKVLSQRNSGDRGVDDVNVI
jgi:hypothetical protein